MRISSPPSLFGYRQAGLLLVLGACFGCAEGVPIGPDDVVILPQLPELPDGGARDASAAPPATAGAQSSASPAPGAAALIISPAPNPRAAAPAAADPEAMDTEP